MNGPFSTEKDITSSKFTEVFGSIIGESLHGKSRVVFDLGSSFPGDFQGEVLVNECYGLLRRVLVELDSFLKTLGKSLSISFTDELVKEKFSQNFNREQIPLEVLIRPMSLSATELSQKAETYIFSSNIILTVLNALWGSDQRQYSIVTLWGDVEKLGATWVHHHQTLNEIFEIEGNGGPRTSHILMDGPFGKFSRWDTTKSIRLSDLSHDVRSLHFFTNCDDKKLIRIWNEFFRKDQCHQCLPCVYGRSSITAETIFTGFVAKAPYQCSLPHRYRQIDDMVEYLQGSLEVRG